MDIRCPKCGEPWDHDELHSMYQGSLRLTYSEACREFRKHGCAAFGAKCSQPPDVEKAAVAGVVYDALGDDMDGAASLMDDMGL